VQASNTRRVLLVATTTGYQTRAFEEAGERLNTRIVYATDRCHMLDDPWRDAALPIRFADEDQSVASILEAAASRPVHGVLAVGDQPTVIAARVAQALGFPGHPPAAAETARNKLRTRQRLRDAGLAVPAFAAVRAAIDPASIAHDVPFPCVIKPLALSGSRGVMRADDPAAFVSAFERLRALLRSPDIRFERNEAHDVVLIESFIEGREFAVEGVMEAGQLDVLAIFDKPDPLDGPFFEETIYVTPSETPEDVQRAIGDGVLAAARAIGLWHGPIHAECRVNASGVFVLEVAARPIGGLCAHALRFTKKSDGSRISLEELLLRHALGEPSAEWEREPDASAVMMIPIPRRGVLRRVVRVERARQVPCVESIRITAKADQVLVPLPEGRSYLGFIFARAAYPADAEHAVRAAHALLGFSIDPDVRVVQSSYG
jgi:biotin carboxylase